MFALVSLYLKMKRNEIVAVKVYSTVRNRQSGRICSNFAILNTGIFPFNTL